MRIFIQKHWRVTPLMWTLLVVELPLTIALLALFGIADPDLYRTTLWQEGSDQGFNSDPSEILYAYANHRPISVPLPWSQSITTFNLVISVLGTFILITKTALFVVRVFIPLLSLLVHILLVALFAYSVYGQSASDYSDSSHPSKTPWYITHNCSISSTATIKGYCEQAKASFAVTVVMLILFAIHIPYSVWCMFPTKEQKIRRASKSGSLSGSPRGKERGLSGGAQQEWEFTQYPQTPGFQQYPLPSAGFHPQTPGTASTARGPISPRTPATPRTQAFQQLGGGTGPVSGVYSPHQGYSAHHSPGGNLPLRERYGDVV